MDRVARRVDPVVIEVEGLQPFRKISHLP
jgi:hypothetical protein